MNRFGPTGQAMATRCSSALIALLAIASGCYGTPRSDWPASGGNGGGGNASGGISGGGSGGISGGGGMSGSKGGMGDSPDGMSGSGGVSGSIGMSGAGGMSGRGGMSGAGGTGGCSGTFDTDSKNCGACGHDCLSGKCERGVCRPFKLADIPHEFVRAIGLAPDYVLVNGTGYMTNGSSAIYTVSKRDGTVKRTRPHRIDGSYSSRLAGTASTLVAADLYTPGNNLYYLSHCALADCSTTIPPAGSYTFDDIRDFAFDPARGRVFWFDPTSHELMFTDADAWSPASAGPASVTGQAPCLTMAQGSGRVYSAFDYGVFAFAEDGDPNPTIVSGVPEGTSLVEIAVAPEALILRAYSGSLYKVPLPVGIARNQPDVIAGTSGVAAIAISGSVLFWSGTSTIYRCDLPLCAQGTPIAQDAAVVRDIAADEKAVYWLSQPDVTDPTSSVWGLAL